MPKTGDINVLITADDSDFKRKIRSFNQKMAGVRRNVNRSALAFGAFAAAGTAAFTAIVNSQRKTIDALAKSADALAITTENLQALNHIAELNGVSSESMAKGLMRMQKALGEAARKGGTSADALKDAGLSIQGIINLSPDEQMQKISDALGNIENQAIKSSIASDLFGRSVGNNMLKVLTQLRKEGVEPTAEKLAELGISISRIDAARVEAANDALYTSQQVISGIANTVTIELSDYIKVLSDRFNDAARESGGFGDEVKAAIEKSLKVAAKFADFLHGLKVVFKGVELIAVGFGAAVITGFEMQAKAIDVLTKGAINDINTVISALNEIPGVDIAKVDYFSNSPFFRGLEIVAGSARQKVTLLRGELHDLAMEEMPSDQVEQFLETVKQKAAEAAQSVASVSTGNITSGEDSNVLPFKGQPTGSIDTASDEFGFNPIEDPFDPEAIAAKNEELLQLDRDFWTNKGAIVDHGLNSITSMIEQKQGKQAGAYANSFASILASTATYSKKAFKIQKNASIAQALVNAYKGISLTMATYPFPVNVAMSAAHAAQAFAQVKAIKSQSFGGGGSNSAGGGTGGASGAIPGASVPQESNVQPAATIVNMNVQGNSIRGSTFSSLTEQLNDEYERGYILRPQFSG